ncbi:MAG: Asp23/Gls24 family envelope stress response protein [Oscillospiraceae bacterium]|nr:Asp23/Gls24 family envelope stress response protein [Oscillospiraceae bacterium]
MEVKSKFQQGTLKVSDEVISSVARLAACEVEGIVGIAEPEASFGRMFVKPDKNDAVKIKISGDTVEISLGVLVKYGCKATVAAKRVQENIKAAVQSMTGIMVSRVDVLIAGVVFENNKKE